MQLEKKIYCHWDLVRFITEDHLKKDGYLWVNGFCERPLNNPSITNNDLLSDDDFEKITCCSLTDKELYISGEHKLVRYIWKKN